MDKEFIPYEQALALKELEFNRRTFAQYDTILNNKWILTFDLSEEGQYPKGSSACIAPTFSQAFRWFREKYNLVHTVYSNASGYIWELHYNQERGGTHICDSGESGDCEMSGMFTTYEKAELECLKKLIEIVKQK